MTYPIPKRTAYYDGEKYHCYKLECQNKRVRVREYGRIWVNEVQYIPLLKCHHCGSTYFGLPSEDRSEVDKYHEERKRAEEERARKAQADNEQSVKEIEREQAEERRTLTDEVETKETLDSGGIILPDIITA